MSDDNGHTALFQAPAGEQVNVPVIRRREGDIEILLRNAEASPVTRVRDKGVYLRGLIHELVELMAASEKERVLRVTIDALTRQRDEAIEELQALNGVHTPRIEPDERSRQEELGFPQVTTKEERALIREWADRNGKPCSVTGRLAGGLVLEYRQAIQRDAQQRLVRS